MRHGQVVKVYDFIEELTKDSFKIKVKLGGKKMRVFKGINRPAALSAMREAGYLPVAWTEGDRIVTQSEKESE